jgi:hypothetical protein
VIYPNELARSDIGCAWAPGDLCPDCLEDPSFERTGRLREIECPDCGGNWYPDDGDGRPMPPCSRCDQGYVFLCDTCGWS